MISTPSSEFDAIVIGGGPAGASVSTTLAQKGRRVIVLEKEKFPRYHIGESLIPWTYFPLERLGMLEKMKASHFVKKFSVQFVTTAGKVSHPFYFHKHTDHPCAQTWQVLRSEFDQMMLNNARQHGATVMEQTLVKELLKDGERIVGVRAVGPDGLPLELRAPITIDASGRDMFSIGRHGWKNTDPVLKKIAVWSYWKGAKRDTGYDEGATTVAFVPEKGWFWYIPLADDIISVGVVAERDYLYRGERDPDAILLREVAGQPWIRDHVACGTKIKEARVTGDYSYRSQHCATDGLVLVGDAFAFLDPVFSSGVCLALHSGVLAGDAVDAALTAGDTTAARFEEYGRKMCQGIEAMRRLVYAFYDQGFSWAKLFKAHPDTHYDATDCLIGNLWRDYDPLFNLVSEFATIPKPLPYGTARIESTVA